MKPDILSSANDGSSPLIGDMHGLCPPQELAVSVGGHNYSVRPSYMNRV
jgi:hypothetical protein